MDFIDFIENLPRLETKATQEKKEITTAGVVETISPLN